MEELLADIEAACTGLLYLDSEVHAFLAPQPVKTLTAAEFLKSIEAGPLTTIEEIDFNEWFEALAEDPTHGEQWNALYALLLSRLADRAPKKVFKVGVDIYAVGLHFPGSEPIRVVGIKTLEI